MGRRPNVDSASMDELVRLDRQIEEKKAELAQLSIDEMNKAPLKETEQQTELSKREAKKMDAPILKPLRTMSSVDKPNPQFEKQRQRDKEYVKVVVENNEMRGEPVELWVKEWPGDPATLWTIPVNKPVMVPREVARSLSKCKYHELKMDEAQEHSSDGMSSYTGVMEVQSTIERIQVRTADFGFENAEGFKP